MNKKLKPINGKAKNIKLMSIDTEDDSKGNVILIGIYDGSSYYSFENQENAIEFLLSLNPKSNTYIWATNLMYDLVNIFYGYFYLLEIIFNGSNVVCAKLKGTNIYFCDTLNHSKISVKEMGEIIGLKKLEFNPDSKSYNKRDCEITYNFMKVLDNYYNKLNTSCKFTIASTALDLFRRNYLSINISKPKDEIIELLKKSYYGGRCEIFNMNKIKGEIYYYDINSLYPYIMLNNLFPNPNHFELYYGDENFSLDNFGVCACEITTTENYLPVLPYKSDSGKLIFPIGTFSGVWALPEIKKAVEKGYKINHIFFHIKYKYADYYFKQYVNDLYSKRLETDDKYMNMVCKILLNSLYGKFAQGNESYKLVPLSECDGNELYCIDNMVFKKIIRDYPVHSNFIWSIYTTSLARLHLFSYLEEVYKKGYKLLYCDTDSIIYEGKKLFDESNNLGGVKIEGKFSEGMFLLPKMYYLKSKKYEVYTAKGIPKYLSKDFIEFGKVEFEKPIKLREGLRRNIKPNLWVKHLKQNKGIYDKREIIEDGSTFPLTVF
ncbi:MAG: hypothetical protein GF317_14790 [Candidatus Lokiarchaeota archaeon]|nr:hypothetical protein [Candidatus Lokiarchaeota archaeon]